MRRRNSSADSDGGGCDRVWRKGSVDFVKRARRRESIMYPAGGFDSELARRFSRVEKGRGRGRGMWQG